LYGFSNANLLYVNEPLSLFDKDRIVTQLKTEFKDVEALSELSLKKIWLNRKDDVWDKYMTE